MNESPLCTGQGGRKFRLCLVRERKIINSSKLLSDNHNYFLLILGDVMNMTLAKWCQILYEWMFFIFLYRPIKTAYTFLVTVLKPLKSQGHCYLDFFINMNFFKVADTGTMLCIMIHGWFLCSCTNFWHIALQENNRKSVVKTYMHASFPAAYLLLTSKQTNIKRESIDLHISWMLFFFPWDCDSVQHPHNHWHDNSWS